MEKGGATEDLRLRDPRRSVVPAIKHIQNSPIKELTILDELQCPQNKMIKDEIWS